MGKLPIVGTNLHGLSLRQLALRQKSTDVDLADTNATKSVRLLIEDLFETLYASHPVSGVGLAAPQIGVLLRVAVIDYLEETDNNNGSISRSHHQIVLVNPRLTHASDEKENGRESCLSFPELSGEVERSMHVTLEAYDQNLAFQEIKAFGWLARIIQHEMDHLDGVLYADRMKSLDALRPIEAPYVRKTKATVRKLFDVH